MGLPRWRDVDDMALVERVQKGFPVRTAATVVSRIDPAGRFLKATDILINLNHTDAKAIYPGLEKPVWWDRRLTDPTA